MTEKLLTGTLSLNTNKQTNKLFEVMPLLKTEIQILLQDISTSSPKGNDRSPESSVPRSNLISKNIQMGHGKQRPEMELVRAFVPVLVTSNFDDDSIKNE